MSIAHARTAPAVDEAEVKRRLSFADGALGAAGHEVTDPTLLELGRLVADGTLTAEEANARGLAYLDAR
ncbi:MAG: hypothetical protein ACOH19_15620 [Rhodoglobus sp.]